MPFFKRKERPNSLPQDPQSSTADTNGSSKIVTPTQNHHIPSLKPPPLQNFVAPYDKGAQSIIKSTARTTSSFREVLLWGKDYFSSFLRSEGVEEILGIWERIGAFNLEDEQLSLKPDRLQSDQIYDEILRLKFQIEKSSFIDLSVLNCEENENNVYRWITKAHKLLHDALQDDYLHRFLESKFYIKCQVDFFTNSDTVTLRDILCNHSALFYFMEYVDQENKREVLEFWLGASNFAEFTTKPESDDDEPSSKIIDTNSELVKRRETAVKEAQSDAMVLYEKYISLQAPHLLGFRDEIRSDVERLICSQKEIAHCFDRAMDEAFLFLHHTCLDGFLKSSLFLAFLTDLINSLSPPTRTHKRSESTSTCSSSSASLTSPYVPTNSSSLHPANKSKLSLGRVNSMGKFEADTDSLDLLKYESGLTKTVKKFVNFDEKEKAKEELAWQVAAMIVNEVLSLNR